MYFPRLAYRTASYLVHIQSSVIPKIPRIRTNHYTRLTHQTKKTPVPARFGGTLTICRLMYMTILICTSIQNRIFYLIIYRCTQVFPFHVYAVVLPVLCATRALNVWDVGAMIRLGMYGIHSGARWAPESGWHSPNLKPQRVGESPGAFVSSIDIALGAGQASAAYDDPVRTGLTASLDRIACWDRGAFARSERGVRKDPDVVCQDRLAWGLGSTGPEITSARSCGRVWTDPGTIQVDSVVQKEHVRSLSCLSLSWLGMTSCACPWCALARATLFIAAFKSVGRMPSS